MCVVMRDSGVEEDVAHFLVGCGGFERDWRVQLDDVCRIGGGGGGGQRVVGVF